MRAPLLVLLLALALIGCGGNPDEPPVTQTKPCDHGAECTR